MCGGSDHRLRAAAGPELLEPVHELLARLWLDEPEFAEAGRVRFETAVAEVAAIIAEHGGASGAGLVTVRLSSATDALDYQRDGVADRWGLTLRP